MVFIRRSILSGLLLWLGHATQAQGTIKTMTEQLAALRAYISTAKQGYHIAEEGLHLVRDIKSGEFDLHRAYFGSLRTVDEAILRSPALDECYRLISAIETGSVHVASAYTSSEWLRVDEIQYIGAFLQKMEDLGRAERKALQMMTQDGALGMTDGARMKWINDIGARLRTRYGSVKSFLEGVTVLMANRQKEGAFIGTLKKWYGIQ